VDTGVAIVDQADWRSASQAEGCRHVSPHLPKVESVMPLKDVYYRVLGYPRALPFSGTIYFSSCFRVLTLTPAEIVVVVVQS
jgi:hypothetical protein